jgi:ubiquinol-cytochrome c reductase iron-sulfur subunit
MSSDQNNPSNPAQSDQANPGKSDDPTRRDFLYLTAGAMGAIGVGAAIWPFIDSMNPAADTLAAATIEVDLSPIEVGQAITVTWRGKPVFIRHRTEKEIQAANQVDVNSLPDPEADENRVINPKWLVMVGICTHLGCVPLGQKPSDQKGEYGGWFCPCHGSHYDESGRIRKGPAPTNLAVPEYTFLNDNRIRIG